MGPSVRKLKPAGRVGVATLPRPHEGSGYGSTMTGSTGAPSREARAVNADVADLLAEGLPIDFTPLAARAYAERCRAAVEALDSVDSPRAVKLITAGIVAATHMPSGDADLADLAQRADETRDIAEQLGDEASIAYALVAWSVTRPAPEFAAERVRAANQILATATRLDEAALMPIGTVLLLVGLLEQGQIRSLDAQLLEQRYNSTALSGTAAQRGTAHADPAQWFSCLRSMLDGDTEGAEQLATSLYAQAQRNGADGLGLYTTQMGMIRWMQGRVDGTEEGFLAARREYPERLLWPASLAWLWLLQGRQSAGEALLQSLPDAADIPRDRYWLSTVTVLAEIARLTGSRANAERLRQMLLPVAETFVPVGVGVAFWGTCARTLGLLEEHLGLLDDAREHLELAVTLNSRIGAWAWHAEAQIELAEFALRHELPDVPAYALLAEAKATSEARGFVMLARRAMHRPRIRVLGQFEVISLCGTRAEWKSRKASELLKMLVAARGVPIAREVLMDVLWPEEPPAKLANRFSVAVNVIRRAFDPDRLLPTQQHLVTEGNSVRLDVQALDIDLERFLTLAARDEEASRGAARMLYRGDAFSEEPYADWAVTIRDHTSHQRSLLG